MLVARHPVVAYTEEPFATPIRDQISREKALVKTRVVPVLQLCMLGCIKQRLDDDALPASCVHSRDADPRGLSTD